MQKYFQVFTAVLLVFLTSCKPKENVVYMSNDNFGEEVSQARYAGLHIQEGDRLEILVSAFDDIAVKPFNKNTMVATGNSAVAGAPAAGEYAVSSEGTISVPVLGTVYVKGMTKQQLKDNLESRLRQYLTDPMVTVTLTNFNISILGEVNSPGQKTSPTEKLNIFQALALAGDMTYDANRTNVKLIRFSEQSGRDEVVAMDLSEASVVNSPYYYLQQNDILYVEPDRNKQVSVNRDAKTDNWLRYGGIGLGIITSVILIITRL